MSKPLKCNMCNENIPKEVYEFSIDKFRYALCQKHQVFFDNPYISEESMHVYFALRDYDIPVIIEYWDKNKTVDIAIPGKIYIEVDGQQHYEPEAALTDLLRSFHAWKDKIPTFRISNESVRNQKHFKIIIERLVELCKDFKKTG